jgi:hypothetical protein
MPLALGQSVYPSSKEKTQMRLTVKEAANLGNGGGGLSRKDEFR